MGVKVRGSLLLHEYTREKNLDVFLLFSSVSSLLGNSGQGAYAAANAFLDSLAQKRRASGLPALTINWGVIGETGMVARDERLQQQLERLGMRGLTLDQVAASLDHLLNLDPVQIGVMDADWGRWMAVHPSAARQPLLSELVAEAASGSATAEGNLASSLGTMPKDERIRFLINCIQKVVADTMRLPQERIDSEEPIRNLGLDSLMAVELATALERRLGIPVPSMELMNGPSVQQLADKISARCVPIPATAGQES